VVRPLSVCYVHEMTISPCSPKSEQHDSRSSLDNLDFVVVDVETACARVSSICQIGIVGFKDGQEVFAYETLVDPRDEFAPFNVGIHGIRPDHVAGKPTFGEIHAVVNGYLGNRVTVAHSWFDKGALAAACRLGDHAPIAARWLDSVRVAKQAWPQLANHKLNVLSRFLGIEHRHHDALSDARAAGWVIIKAIEHTGIGLQGWLANSTPPRAKPPAPADEGPLKGERVVILGEEADGRLAAFIASRGGRVVRSAGSTTTILVIATAQPYGRWVGTSRLYRRAKELQEMGRPLTIISEEELRRKVCAEAVPA
jgi:DNA polymerase-3 subunit epsilon